MMFSIAIVFTIYLSSSTAFLVSKTIHTSIRSNTLQNSKSKFTRPTLEMSSPEWTIDSIEESSVLSYRDSRRRSLIGMFQNLGRKLSRALKGRTIDF